MRAVATRPACARPSHTAFALRRKAAVNAMNLEKNRAEDYKSEKAASEGKVALLHQRNASLIREIEAGKENLRQLKNVVAEAESDGEGRR